MTLDISSIGNEKLAQAAKTADSQGVNAGNGKLDSNELSVFLCEAMNSGCTANEILDITKQVKTEKNDTDIKEKLDTLKQIKQLEKAIESQKRKLEKKENKFCRQQNKSSEPSVLAKTVGFAGWVAGLAKGRDMQNIQIIPTQKNDNSPQNTGYQDSDLDKIRREMSDIKETIRNFEAEKQELINKLCQ